MTNPDPTLAALAESHLPTLVAHKLEDAAKEYRRALETWRWEFRTDAPREKDKAYAEVLSAARVRLLSALTAAQATLGGGWRPIEEADRSKPILAHCDWGIVEMHATHIKGVGDCWEDIMHDGQWVPDYFMPLPPSPPEATP